MSLGSSAVVLLILNQISPVHKASTSDIYGLLPESGNQNCKKINKDLKELFQTQESKRKEDREISSNISTWELLLLNEGTYTVCVPR